MDVSLLHKFCWIVGLTFVILPLINPGMLSDYKICGDSECESLMSRVQAIRDHKSNDCRFLSFRRGDIIFVYHKLTGKREDLWAGSVLINIFFVHLYQVLICKMLFSFFLQKSDFFCIDEFGYPIDSDDDNNQETPKQESNINTFGDEADPPEEVHEIHAASSKQGGSASSSWLSSSVTGWFGVEQLDELPKGEGEDEKTENKDEISLTSSVKGWLGFERNSEQDNADESVTIPDQTTDTIASTKRSDDEKNKHDGEETDEGVEPAEKYRGRRMSLDLEGSQLHEEEKTEMGTLGWLGSKLSSGMGYGLTNQNAGEENKEKEKQEYRFWPNTGIGDMLGFGKENEKVDQDIKREKEQGNVLEEPLESHVETKVLAAPQMDVAKTETSKSPQEEGVQKDPYTQSPEDVKVDSTDTDNYKVDNEDALDRNEINLQRNEDKLQVNELNEKFQMNAEMSSLNSRISLRENKDKNDSEEIQVKESRSEEMVNKGKEIFKSSFNELLSNSLGRSEGKYAQQNEKKEFVKVTTKEYSPAESTDIESKSSDDKKVEGKDFTQKETAIEENRVSGDTEAATELIQDDVSFTPDDKLNLTAIYSDTSDTGSHQDKSQIEEEAKSVWSSRKESGSSISAQNDESLSEYPSKENDGKVSSSDRTSTIYKEPAVNIINNEEMTHPHEQVEKETLGFGEDVLSQSDLKSTPRPETETKKIEMLRGGIETNEKGNHSKKEEKQQELNGDNEEMDEMKDKQQTDTEGKKKEDNMELEVRGKKMEATMEEEKDTSASKDEEVAELKEEEGHQVNKVKQKDEQQADNEKQMLLKEEQLVMLEDKMEYEEENKKEEDEKKNLQNVEMERIYSDRSTKALDSHQKEGTGDSLSSTTGTVTESENQELEIEKQNKKETQDVEEVIDKRMEVNEVDDKRQTIPVEADPLKCPNCPEEQETAVTEEHEEEGRSVEQLQQKLQIMTEMYQENELKLHRYRLTKEKLSKADKNIAMAIEELNNYRQRAEEMGDEMKKTKQSYETQISAHEKKAHNNWPPARLSPRGKNEVQMMAHAVAFSDDMLPPVWVVPNKYKSHAVDVSFLMEKTSGPGDRRTPPELDPRMGGPPLPRSSLGPTDGPFPRRGSAPYGGPPPTDFYPPRGMGGPLMRPSKIKTLTLFPSPLVWAPPPSGMMFPPRFPPSGPLLPPASHPNMPPYRPLMGPLPPNSLPPPSMGPPPPPPQQPIPSAQPSQLQEKNSPPPEDLI
uniref:Uncharacterized protein n=1 Tax=Oryzias latipes TaxID=8090 RepID=A0A3B3ICW2_ORYLA